MRQLLTEARKLAELRSLLNRKRIKDHRTTRQKGEKRPCLTIYKVFSWTLLIISVIMAPTTIWVKDTTFARVSLIHKIVFDFSIVVMYVTNIYISALGILKQKQLSKLLGEVLEDISSGYGFILHFTIFVIYHTIGIVMILFTQFQRSDSMTYQFVVLFGDGFLTFRLVGVFFIISLIIKRIREKLKKFNKKLTQPNEVMHIKAYRVSHNILCDHIQTVNSLCGLILLLVILFIITTFLRHAVFTSQFYNTLLVAMVRCSWILASGCQAAYLAYVGQQIAAESEQTVAICYKQMLKTSTNKIENDANQEFFLLAQQVVNRTTKISAAGFFNIDNSMILFMATTFFTYFIVVMQLMFCRSC
ncbi:putative gustatory receptor 28b isoform X2 [Euwallacea fornicatus]|uniref:putative gustatory receptor 28b isoform X2 n=1 Tax=Euwallacea fornicatus TaxID=995702 RepID=UPI00338E2792